MEAMAKAVVVSGSVALVMFRDLHERLPTVLYKISSNASALNFQ